MTALKRRLEIEHFAEQQFLQKCDTFWLFLGYRDILIVIFIWWKFFYLSGFLFCLFVFDLVLEKYF